MIEKMIAEWTGEPKFQPSNAINAFIALFYLIKSNLQLLDSFDGEVQSVVRGSLLSKETV